MTSRKNLRFARPLLLLPFLLTGCNAISDMADRLGSHMPTIGEPCHHWQCITPEGQRKSDENRVLEQASEKIPMVKKPGAATQPQLPPAPPAAPVPPTTYSVPSPEAVAK